MSLQLEGTDLSSDLPTVPILLLVAEEEEEPEGELLLVADDYAAPLFRARLRQLDVHGLTVLGQCTLGHEHRVPPGASRTRLRAEGCKLGTFAMQIVTTTYTKVPGLVDLHCF